MRNKKFSIKIFSNSNLFFYLSLYAEDEGVARVSPLLGNVCFASSQYGFCFTLVNININYFESRLFLMWGNSFSFPQESFARKYLGDDQGPQAAAMGKKLWGDFYFEPKTRYFARKI